MAARSRAGAKRRAEQNFFRSGNFTLKQKILRSGPLKQAMEAAAVGIAVAGEHRYNGKSGRRMPPDRQ